MGFFSKIGKVFKKVFKSKIFKIVLIAAAVYFTAGIAAGMMGSSFALTLPGIEAVGSALGITAGAFGEAAAAAGMVAGEGLGMLSAAEAASIASETAAAGAATAGEAVSGAASGGMSFADASTAGLSDMETSIASNVGNAATPQPGLAPGDTGVTNALQPTDVTPKAPMEQVTSAQVPGSTAPSASSQLPAPETGPLGDKTLAERAVESAGKGNVQPGLWENVNKWWTGMGPAGQTMLGQGIMGVGKGLLGGMQQKELIDYQKEMRSGPSAPNKNTAPKYGIYNSMYSSGGG